MPHTIRSRNLDLIRWMKGGHKRTAKIMEKITNENYLSKMATGDRVIGDSTARKIEEAAMLPEGWLDRENDKVLLMDADDYRMLQQFMGYAPAVKDALVSFLLSLRDAGE